VSRASYCLLSDADVQALVDHLITLTHLNPQERGLCFDRFLSDLP
jgi:hypothetical protein